MFGSWLTDAFRTFLTALNPLQGQAPPDGWGPALLGVWLPDLTGANFTHVMVLTAGLGLAIGLWYAWAALTAAMVAADARALLQVFVGLAVTAATVPTVMALVAALREPVITTAGNLAVSALPEIAVQVGADPSTSDSMLLALMAVLGSITYLVAGIIGGFAFALVVALAPIAMASLIFRSGIQTAAKWLAWFGTLLLAPIWAAIAMVLTADISTNPANGEIIGGLVKFVGVIVAAAAPFTVLAMIGKVIPHGGGADGATKIGAGHTAGSQAMSTASRLARK